MKVRFLLGVTLYLLLATASPAQVVLDVTSIAVNNATVQPAGPRMGPNGKRFFNIQGNNNGQFASFGVVDFATDRFGLTSPVVDVASMVLRLYDAPAAFSRDGTVDFWLTTKTNVNIEPESSPLRWNTGNLPSGLDPQLLPVYYLGSGNYNKQSNDVEFVYSLTVPANAKSYLLNRINAGATIRLVVTPATDSVSATYAGYNHSTIRPPTLQLGLVQAPTTVVPEPASVVSMMVGLVGLAGVAWRRRRAG